MILTDDEKRMISGEVGVGAQKCMKLLVQWGELFGAEGMIKVSNAHLSTNFAAEAVIEMSEGTNKVRTLSTTHTVFDPKSWRENYGVVAKSISGGYVNTDEEKFVAHMDVLSKLGVLPTSTCSPYLIGIIPRPGDVFCMTGSSGQIISNSFFAARAGRESVSTCFAAAVTGKTPLMGLLVKENRYAKVLIQAGKDLDFSKFSEADYGALGYYIGEIAGTRNVAIEGIPLDITFEHGRMLVSPMPVSGACVMCHIIGLTPEAHTLEEALGGIKPQQKLVAGKKEIKQIYERLNSAENDKVDMVVIGCPHLSIIEIGQVAFLLEGKKLNNNVHLVIGISNTAYALAKECGYMDPIERAGAIISNTCVSGTNPFLFLDDPPGVAATNSARGAHYMQRTSGGRTKTYYGDMKKCIQAAISGRWEE
jgi:cis-L-3-hydroxyproline dehydratase